MILLLSNRDSAERRALRAAALAAQGVEPVVLAGWRAPPELAGRSDVRFYGEVLLGEAICGALRLALLDPPADWLARCPEALLSRRVRAMTLGEARGERFPAFVKASDDKLGGVPGRVYARAADLPDAGEGTPVLISDIVAFEQEVRLFCLDGAAAAGSGYWRGDALWEAPLQAADPNGEAREFARRALREAPPLPPGVVLDVGRLPGGEWAIIEANGAWGAGLYAADPAAALPCILAASAGRVDAAALPAEWRREPEPAEWR